MKKTSTQLCVQGHLIAQRRVCLTFGKETAMAQKNGLTVALIVLAAIVALPILVVLGMWLVHAIMMKGTMGTGGITAVAGGVSGRLLTVFFLGLVVVMMMLIVRRKSRRQSR
jgi:hypothetical protein